MQFMNIYLSFFLYRLAVSSPRENSRQGIEHVNYLNCMKNRNILDSYMYENQVKKVLFVLPLYVPSQQLWS